MRLVRIVAGTNAAPKRIRAVMLLALCGAFCLPSCVLGPSSADTAANPAAVSEDLGFCVQEINRYRAMAAVTSLAQSATLEAFATNGAQVDSAAGMPHEHFTQTDGGGVARAETELLNWPDQTIHAVIQQGLQKMWDEGPSGEHYRILVGPYSQVGCGLSSGAGGLTIVQDYR